MNLQYAKTGKSLKLIEHIASGGQGEVWTTSDTKIVAKLYKQTMTSEQVEKLQVMSEDPPNDPALRKGHVSIAWCIDLLKDQQNNFVGYAMPKVQNSRTILNVFLPTLRNKVALGFNWYYLHQTAQNLASVVQAIHQKNYVIGDIKAENLLVNASAQVSIVDTDSFQIRNSATGKVYRCLVGTGSYTPPELLGKNLQTVDRLELHDRFGLGIIIYQLLFGYHPFLGVLDTPEQLSLEERISKGLWLHSPNATVKPGRFSIPLEVVHPSLRTCFQKCFTVGYENPHLRPTATEWYQALKLAIADLTVCSHSPEHHYTKTNRRCCWCDYKAKTSVDLFPPVPSTPKTHKIKTPSPVVTTVGPTPRNNSLATNNPIAWILALTISLSLIIPPIRQELVIPMFRQIVQTFTR
ncbi:hypothetical protein Q2T42_20020 [Leptolyngbya boryana CZ1]|uniref:Protein kinase domain-containing protein n=1 Tax=Leptolyngbya boryana CZ1 TaxID=3060204 RepID=A0AA96X224_LEPBY|nr:hypothetical protein [Leptolyngbya boryana]WNZ44120.1 hypothetical protein Q2T42_20020 [Leptolyngbya boryana CZ1]